MIDEIRLRQKQQREKLIELAKEWMECGQSYQFDVDHELTGSITAYSKLRMLNAEKAFRDYVEHMHDMPLPSQIAPNTLEALEFFKCLVDNVVPLAPKVDSTPYPKGMKNGYLKLMEESVGDAASEEFSHIFDRDAPLFCPHCSYLGVEIYKLCAECQRKSKEKE